MTGFSRARADTLRPVTMNLSSGPDLGIDLCVTANRLTQMTGAGFCIVAAKPSLTAAILAAVHGCRSGR